MSLGEWILSEIRVGALEIKRRPVNFICAGLRLRRHHSADGLAEFRVVILLSNLNFLDGIKIWINDDNSENWVLVIRTVQLKGCAAEVLSLSLNLLRSLWFSLAACWKPTM